MTARIKERLERLEIEPIPVPRGETLLEQIMREEKECNRYVRLACFFDLLMQSDMTSDPRINPVILSQAHDAFLKWNYYDKPLLPYHRDILLRCVHEQHLTVADVWREFGPADMSLPEGIRP